MTRKSRKNRANLTHQDVERIHFWLRKLPSQRAVAKRMGLATSTISRVARNEMGPRRPEKAPDIRFAPLKLSPPTDSGRSYSMFPPRYA